MSHVNCAELVEIVSAFLLQILAMTLKALASNRHSAGARTWLNRESVWKETFISIFLG